MKFDFNEKLTTISFSWKERLFIFFKGRIKFDEVNLIKFENALITIVGTMHNILSKNKEDKIKIINKSDKENINFK